MFANPDELAIRLISEYKEQNFSDLKPNMSEKDEMIYYYSRWALDEIGLCVLCSNLDGAPSKSIRKFKQKVESYLKGNDLDEMSKLIFSTAYKVTCDILEILECYQYEYFTVM